MKLARATRRSVLGGMTGFGLAGLLPSSAGAQTRQAAAADSGPLRVPVEGNLKPIPIAITDFVGEDAQIAADVSGVVAADLERSGLFQPLDRASFLEQIQNPDQMPNMNNWRPIRADALAVGRVLRGADGRMEVQFRLWDVASGKQLAGQRFAGVPQANWRRAGHLVADQIYERLTGEKGYFNTRIVFIDETGPKERRIKRLSIMDQDGGNVRNLTRGDELVVTPRFSPSSQDVTYMAFGQGDPRVNILNIETGQREVVGNFPGMTFSPRFSPDGQKIIMSLSQGSASNLFTMDLRSRTTTRLTDTAGIDTSPSFSPDGSQIVFESDRGGTQQVYVMGAAGGSAKRISYGEAARYSTPVWSPKGDYIAFTRQKGGAFGIGVMKPDGSGERIITEGYHNEAPTFAPNGLYVMFFREPGGAAGPKIFMADIFGRAEFPVATPSFGSDPAWGPLLS